MSSSPNSSMSNDVGSGHSGHYIVPPQTIHSAISTHQQQDRWIGVPRSDVLLEGRKEVQDTLNAYLNGQISGAEFDAVLKRIRDARHDYDERVADYDARKAAGQTKPGDWFKEFHGLTDQQTEEYMRQGIRAMDIRRANEQRSGSRILHQSRLERGH